MLTSPKTGSNRLVLWPIHLKLTSVHSELPTTKHPAVATANPTTLTSSVLNTHTHLDLIEILLVSVTNTAAHV